MSHSCFRKHFGRISIEHCVGGEVIPTCMLLSLKRELQKVTWLANLLV